MDERIAKQFTISKASPVPLYFQLKTQLVELLKQGIFQAGDKLPTEAEFCELLDISRPTVRQAFSELINEGYITRHKAKGTFVSRPKIEGYFFQKLGSFDEEMRSLHLTPSTRVIVSEVIELPEECVEIYPKANGYFTSSAFVMQIMRRWFWSIPSYRMSTFWISSWRISNSLPYMISSHRNIRLRLPMSIVL